jgi:hypothetical protein
MQKAPPKKPVSNGQSIKRFILNQKTQVKSSAYNGSMQGDAAGSACDTSAGS